MPHINIKCYPKNLSEQELQAFADDLTAASKHACRIHHYRLH